MGSRLPLELIDVFLHRAQMPHLYLPRATFSGHAQPDLSSVSMPELNSFKIPRGGDAIDRPPLRTPFEVSMKIIRIRVPDDASFPRVSSGDALGPWDDLDPWTTSPNSEKTASPKTASPLKPRRRDPRPATVCPTHHIAASGPSTCVPILATTPAPLAAAGPGWDALDPWTTSPRSDKTASPKTLSPLKPRFAASRPSTCVPILATAPAPPAAGWGQRRPPAKAQTPASSPVHSPLRSLRTEAARLGAVVFAPSGVVPGGLRFPEPLGVYPSGSALVETTDRLLTTRKLVGWCITKPIRVKPSGLRI